MTPLERRLEAVAQFIVCWLCVFTWGASIVGVLVLLAEFFMEWLLK
jgi:hypothetical protein